MILSHDPSGLKDLPRQELLHSKPGLHGLCPVCSLSVQRVSTVCAGSVYFVARSVNFRCWVCTAGCTTGGRRDLSVDLWAQNLTRQLYRTFIQGPDLKPGTDLNF